MVAGEDLGVSAGGIKIECVLQSLGFSWTNGDVADIGKYHTKVIHTEVGAIRCD